MKMQANISQRMDQRLALVPGMLQSIEILAMSTMDLVARIETEIAQNETLEATDSRIEEPTVERGDETFDPDRFRAPRSSGEDAKHEWLQNVPALGEGLCEHLKAQLMWRELPAELRESVELLIEALDERGLLPLSDGELAALVGADHVEPALDVLRSFEPRGVGARDAVEALLLQISPSDPDYAIACALLRDHLEDLSRNRIPDVARALGLAVDEVLDVLDRMKSLELRPGALFAVQSVARIRPDLVVVREPTGEFRVVVDDVDVPVLRLNEEYVELARTSDTDRSVRSYLRGRLQSARELMLAVRQRKETLARVGAAVMAHQRAFLEDGQSAFRPLKMSSIAQRLDVHNSTVSRAIAGKYVQTDHGVFLLRDFFDGDRRNQETDSGTDKGRMAIRHAIGQLIAGENKSDPLSDEQLVDLLRQQGIEVARRTVAKHRKELGLRSSWQRRRHGNR